MGWSPRIPCQVPGCRRTHAAEQMQAGHNERLCQDHFRAVDASLKRLRRRMKKRHGDSPRGRRIDCWIWRRMKRQAIERAAGL